MKSLLPAGLLLLLSVSFPSVIKADTAASAEPLSRPFTKLELGTPRGLAVDLAGNLYIADVDLGKMHKISPAGEATAFGGLPIRSAIGLAVAPDGAVVVADAEDNALYRITGDGTIKPLFKPAGETSLRSPTNLAVDEAGDIFVANNLANNVLKITPEGAVSVFAGKTGESGSIDGLGGAARFNTPLGIAIDAQGDLYVADKDNSNIRKITPEGMVSTLAGAAGQRGSADGVGAAARFAAPRALAADAGGTVFVADTENHCIRKITPEGKVSTLAGKAGEADRIDGGGSAARFNDPRGIAVDRAGNVYVGDCGNGAIRQITPDGAVTTLAASAKEVVRVQLAAPLVPPRAGQSERSDYSHAPNLEGWDGDPTYWSVNDGAFTAKGEKVPSTFLLTRKNYSDFRLTLSSRMIESENHAGVVLWGEQTISGSGKNKWACKGPLVIFPGLSLWDYRTNKNIPVDPAGKALAKKIAGQHDWIQVEILAQGNRLRVAYNGQQVLDWREPNPSLLKTGPIGLQLHGYTKSQEVVYKDVVIESFPREDRLITVKE